MPQRGMRPPNRPPFLFSAIWLVYLVLPISVILQMPLQDRFVGMTLLAVFAAMYIYGYRNRRGRLLTVLGQIAIIGYFSFEYDVTFLYLAFYPSPVIGTLIERRQIVTAMAALLSMFTLAGIHTHLTANIDQMLQMLPALIVMLVLPIGMGFRRRSSELQNKLELANEEIARLSKNEERQRISRDLHDTLGHTLSLITLKSELAEKLVVKQPERAAQEIRDIQMTSRAALKQVRELVSGMNSVTVGDEVTHAKQILSAAGIELKSKGGIHDPVPTATPLVENILGMCLREAVTNVVKHSKAKICTIEWKETNAEFLLSVGDDGIGRQVSNSLADGTGNGLNGMRERLKLIEGKLQFESEPGRGTRVTFWVPRVNKTIVTEGAGG